MDDLAAPGGIASPFPIKVWERDVGVIVPCPAINGLQIKLTTVVSTPSRVADAGVVAGANAIEAAVFHALAAGGKNACNEEACRHCAAV